MKEIEIIPTEKIGEYGCSPCWGDSGRDVDATVALHHTYGVLDWPQTTYLCSNHAECIDATPESESK